MIGRRECCCDKWEDLSKPAGPGSFRSKHAAAFGIGRTSSECGSCVSFRGKRWEKVRGSLLLFSQKALPFEVAGPEPHQSQHLCWFTWGFAIRNWESLIKRNLKSEWNKESRNLNPEFKTFFSTNTKTCMILHFGNFFNQVWVRVYLCHLAGLEELWPSYFLSVGMTGLAGF